LIYICTERIIHELVLNLDNQNKNNMDGKWKAFKWKYHKYKNQNKDSNYRNGESIS
jgi:hypothetical protein